MLIQWCQDPLVRRETKVRRVIKVIHRPFQVQMGLKAQWVHRVQRVTARSLRFSIEFMECLADCGQGPVVIVGEKTYEYVQGKRAEQFAEQVKDGTLDSAGDFFSYEDALAKPGRKATAKPKKKVVPASRKVLAKK